MPRYLLPVLLALVTAGCGLLYRQPIYQGNLLDQQQVEQLQAGMTRAQVQALLGTPSIADPFHADRWDYAATQRTGRIGKAQVKDLTVWFDDGKLARWEGEYFPENDAALAESLRRTFGYYPKSQKDKEKARQRSGGGG